MGLTWSVLSHCSPALFAEHIEEEAPQFTQTLSPVELREGDKLSLSCSFTGQPDPNIEWFFNGQVSRHEPRHSHSASILT